MGACSSLCQFTTYETGERRTQGRVNVPKLPPTLHKLARLRDRPTLRQMKPDATRKKSLTLYSRLAGVPRSRSRENGRGRRPVSVPVIASRFVTSGHLSRPIRR